jgi:hypothetical protein
MMMAETREAEVSIRNVGTGLAEGTSIATFP